MIIMNNNSRNIARGALFLAIAIVFQLIGRVYPQVSQMFVGPIINAVLLLATSICGLWIGISIGILTPILAWTLGQLPAPFAPFIPFIIIGNLIFIVVYYNFSKINKFGQTIGVVVGAILKFLFLYLCATKIIVVLKLITNPKIVSKLSVAMGFLQLITALIGGIIAIILLNILKSRKQL